MAGVHVAESGRVGGRRVTAGERRESEAAIVERKLGVGIWNEEDKVRQ